MKKLISLMLALILSLSLLSFTGCNEQASTASEGEPTSFPQVVQNGQPKNIISGGSSQYKIVVPQNATDTVLYAAQELSDFLYQSSNCRLSIITDENVIVDTSCKYISLGETKLLKAQEDVIVDYNIQYETAPVIQTRNNTVFISGAMDMGTLFGVYKFLYYSIDFVSYYIDCIEFSKMTDVPLLDFDYTYTPAVFVTSVTDRPLVNQEVADDCARFFTYAGANGGVSIEGRLFSRWCHTVESFVPQSEYPGHSNKNDLENFWFSSQYCYSNEGLIKEFEKQVLAHVLETNMPYVMVGGLDNTSRCECLRCLEHYAKYGGAGGVYVRFLNRISQYIDKYFAENNIDRTVIVWGLMYEAYKEPPVTFNEDGSYEIADPSVICAKNVGVYYTPVACAVHPFTLDSYTCETNETFSRGLKGWSLICNNLAIYAYGTNFNCYTQHHDNWGWRAETVKFCKEIGLRKISEQGNSYNGALPLTALRTFIRSKQNWDPTVDVDVLIDEFMLAYYKEGAPYMREYYDIIRRQYQTMYNKKGTECANCYTALNDPTLWSKKVMDDILNTIDMGMQAVKQSDRPESEKEMLVERMHLDWFLMKFNEVKIYNGFYTANELAELNKMIEEYKIKYNMTDVR